MYYDQLYPNFCFFIARHCIATCKMVPNHAYTVLNKIVIYVCLPALALYYILKSIGVGITISYWCSLDWLYSVVFVLVF
jgi:predicted permease